MRQGKEIPQDEGQKEEALKKIKDEQSSVGLEDVPEAMKDERWNSFEGESKKWVQVTDDNIEALKNLEDQLYRLDDEVQPPKSLSRKLYLRNRLQFPVLLLLLLLLVVYPSLLLLLLLLLVGCSCPSLPSSSSSSSRPQAQGRVPCCGLTARW